VASLTTTPESQAANTRPVESFHPKAPRRGLRKLARLIVLPIPLRAYESTDDAQVDGHIQAISERIDGYVRDVPVDDEHYLKAGDVLARIDPKDYEIALAQAEADLAAAEASLQGFRVNVPVTSTTTGSQLPSARSGKVDALAALSGAERQATAIPLPLRERERPAKADAAI
jgi:membrane fusion protein (multidrug efflux system)